MSALVVHLATNLVGRSGSTGQELRGKALAWLSCAGVATSWLVQQCATGLYPVRSAQGLYV